MKRRVYLKASAICVLLWVVVGMVQGYLRGMQATAVNLERLVAGAESDFEDWSGREDEPGGEVARRREETIREILTLRNRLDFREREKAAIGGDSDRLFWKLSKGERKLYASLRFDEPMENWIAAFDALEEDDQKKFFRKNRKAFAKMLGGEEKAGLLHFDEETVMRISKTGFRMYIGGLSPEEKIKILPELESMSEVTQALRGVGWGGF